jgi:hypothetical protein
MPRKSSSVPNKESHGKRGRPPLPDVEKQVRLEAGQAMLLEATRLSGLTLRSVSSALFESTGVDYDTMRQYSCGAKRMRPSRLVKIAHEVQRHGWEGPETRAAMLIGELWETERASGLQSLKPGKSPVEQARELSKRKLFDAVVALLDTASPQQVVMETLTALYRADAITDPTFAGLTDDSYAWVSVEVKPMYAVTVADLGTSKGHTHSKT